MDREEKDMRKIFQNIIQDAGRPAGEALAADNTDFQNHKGCICRINPLILCQEGYCSECWISINKGS
jgi:hypothetical protein